MPFGPPISLEVAAHRHVGPFAAHDPARGLAAAIGVVEQVWGLLRPQPAVRALLAEKGRFIREPIGYESTRAGFAAKQGRAAPAR